MGQLDDFDLYAVAASLITSPDAAERARTLTSTVTGLLPDTACVLYRLLGKGENGVWTRLASSGEVSASTEVPLDSSTFLQVAASAEPVVHAASELSREDYAHLHLVRTFSSIGYVPLIRGKQLVGVFEIVGFEQALTSATLDEFRPLARLGAAGILAAERYREEQQDHYESIHRLTQLYDLEKQLNATLELESVMELVPQKVIGMLPSQAIHLWLFDGDDLRLMSSYGDDPTVEPRSTQAAGEGYVGDMAEEGEATIIVDPDDERLVIRNASLEDGDSLAIRTSLLVPLMQDDSEVGVVEAVNRSDGQPFDDDDLFFLSTMSETISSALKNASLMFAERKLEILETLVQVSGEITSTLQLDRLLQIIVNSPQAVLAFERCSVALDNRGKLQLKAVSGMDTIRTGDIVVDRLRALLTWLSERDEQLLVRQHDEQPEHEDDEVRKKIAQYFEESGVRALFSLPLTDDQGRVGLLLYESGDADFLELAQIEMIKVLAGQATVAMRNALLYREVPLIALMEPMLRGKRSFLRSSEKRRWAWLGVAAALLLFLVFCPWRLRLSGAALVAPRHIVSVASPVQGVVTTVYAHEGQKVAAGALLGELGDTSWRREYAAAQTKYAAQMLAMQNDLATQSPLAGRDRTQAEFLRAEMERAQQRIVNAQLRSPIEGIVVTPQLQNVAGKYLDAGTEFAQVLDVSSVVINVAVDEEDAPLLRQGQPVSIKLTSFPMTTLHGTVSIVSPQAELVDGRRAIMARVSLPNGGELLRDGMDGRAKISAGYRPAGYVLLRRPALWAWQTIWNWIGW